jgi:hypothetical protein
LTGLLRGFEICAPGTPRPPRATPARVAHRGAPAAWGIETRLVELFGPHVHDILSEPKQ